MKKSKNKKKLRRETIAQLIRQNPEFARMLELQGLHCANCPLAQFETLEEGFTAHGLTPLPSKKLKPKAKSAFKKPIRKTK